MTSIASLQANPYLGPRSFQTGERLYGRDREARELLSLLIAERLVLLYSPSGAGKSSLLNASVIPTLEAKEFIVLPVVRVNTEPASRMQPVGPTQPPTVERSGLRLARGPELASPTQTDRYTRSAILSLEEALPAEEQLTEEALSKLSLAAYLAQIVPADSDAVLLFDQFEEVLTVDPTDMAAKHAFFAGLGEALRDRRFWAVIAMREDYIAGLDPFLHYLPTRLKTTFRLDLLATEGAYEALTRPAQVAGVAFEHAPAQRLIDDLRRVNVQRPDGSVEVQLGPSVEPVQLQVVARRLWASKFANGYADPLEHMNSTITMADVTALGDVSQALGDYYAERVAELVAKDGLRERTIREWFDRELITPQGLRGQVLQGVGESAGLPNQAIRPLVDAYLVRGEKRRGATWYELAHDRLIAPVRSSNTAWFAANLSTLQRQADLWERQGRPAGLLLRDEALSEAEAWAAQNAELVTPGEEAFLALCREARAALERERQQARRIRNLAVVASLVSVIALAALAVALWFFNRSEQQRRLATARELAAAALNNLSVDPERSVLLAVQAVDSTRPVGQGVVPEAQQALQEAQQASRIVYTLDQAQDGLFALAYSPTGMVVATAGREGVIRLYDAATGALQTELTGHSDEVYRLAYNNLGTQLASAGADGNILLWDSASGTQSDSLAVEPESVVEALAYHPNGQELAVGLDNGSVMVWDLRQNSLRYRFTADDEGAVNALAYSPDGSQLATGGLDTLTRIWQLGAEQAPTEPIATLEGHSLAILDLAFSPDGQYLVSTGQDYVAIVWEREELRRVATLAGHGSTIYGLAFAPDSKLLATASADGTVKVWSVALQKELFTLAGHSDSVQRVAFQPNGQQLMSVSLDGSARAWSLRFAPAEGATFVAWSPDGRLLASAGADGAQIWDALSGQQVGLLAAHSADVSGLAWSPDGRHFATASLDSTVNIWDGSSLLNAAQPLRTLVGHNDAVGRIAWSPDGRTLATASDDLTIRVWDVEQGTEQLLLEGHSSDIFGVAFSPDGQRIVSASQDGTALVYDAANGTTLHTLQLPAEGNSVQYSPDGKHLLFASENGSAVVYDALSYAPLLTLPHNGPVYYAAYSSDGQRIVTASSDDSAIVWDAATAEQLVRLPHPNDVYASVFSPDGRYVATSSADGLPRMFPLEIDLLLSEAHITRSLSAEECQIYHIEPCPPGRQ
jgi:WD40 repeat protein